MADALVSGVYDRLTSFLLEVAENGVRLVVEKRQVKEQAVKSWLDKLQSVVYDIEDLLDRWSTAVLESNITSSLTFPVRRAQPARLIIPRIVRRGDVALKIKEIHERLEAIAKEKDDYAFILNPTRNNDLQPERPKTTRFIDVSEIRGREQDKNTLISMLLSENNPEERGIPIISIVGMGGIGKTTLAQIVYNHRELNAYFQKKLWVCVSDPFDEMRIAKAILEALTGSASSFIELNAVLDKIDESITGKRILLVLDDVWTEDERKWQSLKYCLNSGASQGSKILVTTRKKNVATLMGYTKLFRLGKLSAEECWSLFSHISFSGRNDRERENLADIGKKIADKCNGLPLAAKTLGSLLRFKRSREQWQRILDSRMWELDEVENGLFSLLLLSYYDLPSPLRQCFSYCAIFPKDHKIEKDLLIKLWMAQGFLGETHGNEMEIVGEEYFGNLAMRSFFQELEKDENDDSIIRCKMHDIVHEFAQFLRKNECFAVSSNGIEEQKAEGYHENLRHLTLILENEEAAIPNPLYNAKKLRSLLVDSSRYNTSTLDASLPRLFDQLTFLRMLDLSNNRFRRQSSITELPSQLGELIHLRYLSLEGNKGLEYLPETLCDLCNLQTLNIRLCSSLRKLPFGIGRLFNLRHLQNAETYGCLFMPIEIHMLTRLQTLEELVVCEEYISGGSFSLRALRGLAHLQGNLKIIGLGNVRRRNAAGEARVRNLLRVGNDGQTEAEEAGLRNKIGLRNLTLSFNSNSKNISIEEEALVIEALQPPLNLEYLNINRLNGPTLFPSWMASLTMLKRVILWACFNWETLPPMGKLPFLEHLEIREMKKVKKVGQEFVGAEREEGQTSSSSSSSSVNNNISFPNLKHLKFQIMEEWQEWEYGNLLTTMPLLCYLKINTCLKLKSLPRHLLQKTTLQVLEIFDCPILKERCLRNGTGEDWPYISCIPTIIFDGEDVQRDGQ